MKPCRFDKYLAGDAEPEALKRHNGSNTRDELKRLTEWLAKRGEPRAWPKRKGRP